MKFLIRLLSVTVIIALGWSGVYLFTYSNSKEGDEVIHQNNFKQDYKIYSLATPKKLDFCGETVPLKLIDVKEKLDRELLVNTYWQSQTMLFLKRSHRYFPIIEQVLKSNGVPEDFKYLALIESGLEHVVSPAGATGFWQIMKATGKDYGLEINDDVDERYNLVKSTEFACKYLKDAYAKFGSWTMAAASYNMGINGLERSLEKQKVNNYYDLLLNTETGRYLFRILAVKQIMEHPNDYGFNFLDQHLYPQLATKDTVITQPISDLAVFAAEKRINYKILKSLNPWLRSNNLPVSAGKSYTLKLPTEKDNTLKPFKLGEFEANDSLN
ncbi:lytic transglycosylase domain-containing protein [Luteibaculum oceani]|uniref:Lytic transglycosylase domain-containing protein n=1 Tax=Luteibaculum oceani TaxID=1294296 RepID=A0A5C6UUP1_9FLAO|nr:lytic transglycosylase domain-containing protein [Luteibaculum oceani]TXC77037.1 lytic transglycosylase domain-containing protein [Luteibaculum oceani]